MSAGIGVFASGGGTNLQALLDRFNATGSELARVVLVISDRESAGALDRAEAAGVPGRVIPVKGRETADVAGETLDALAGAGADMVALAGYLRLIPARVVEAFRWRMLNIHPALLPSFGGEGMWGHHVHEAVLASGARVSGATVHYVDERYDTGLVLAQWPVPVIAGDTPDALAARVLRVEHVLYPAAVERVAGALVKDDGAVRAERLEALYAFPDDVVFKVESGTPPADEIRRALGLQD